MLISASGVLTAVADDELWNLQVKSPGEVTGPGNLGGEKRAAIDLSPPGPIAPQPNWKPVGESRKSPSDAHSTEPLQWRPAAQSKGESAACPSQATTVAPRPFVARPPSPTKVNSPQSQFGNVLSTPLPPQRSSTFSHTELASHENSGDLVESISEVQIQEQSDAFLQHQEPWDFVQPELNWGYEQSTGAEDNGVGRPLLPAEQPQSPFQFQEPVDPADAPALPPSLQAARLPVVQPPAAVSEMIPEFVESASTNAGILEVVVGQGRLVTLRQDIAVPGSPEPIVAVGDPTVLDLEVAGPRHLRITGARIGVTDVSVITPDRANLSLEVRVVADLKYVEAILRQSFPTARVRMSQLREHVVVEGQARDARQVAQIVDLIQTYLESVQTPSRVTGVSRASANVPRPQGARLDSPQGEFDANPGIIAPAVVPEEVPEVSQPDGLAAGILPDTNQPNLQVTIPPPRVINLLTVPGPQQVMLKVQVAELNRTALRTFGVSFLFQDGQTAIGSAIGPSLPGVGAGLGGLNDLLLGLLNPLGTQGTLFAVLQAGEVNFFVDALRRNEVLKIMAEPTLVAMNGQEASFLAGGEFPVPVPQIAAAGVVSAGFQFKPFGVGLTFIPFIQEDDVIRLAVAPEVSALDFATPAAVLPDTITPVPAFSTR